LRLGLRDGACGGAAAVEGALASGNFGRPVRRRWGGRRGWRRGSGRRRQWHRLLDPALRLERCATRFGDDLIEPAVEPSQRVADAIGRIFVGVAIAVTIPIARSRGTPAVRAGEAFEMAREFVEAVVDSGEIVADRLLIVLVVAM
jgi:hypothetical protein